MLTLTRVFIVVKFVGGNAVTTKEQSDL